MPVPGKRHSKGAWFVLGMVVFALIVTVWRPSDDLAAVGGGEATTATCGNGVLEGDEQCEIVAQAGACRTVAGSNPFNLCLKNPGAVCDLNYQCILSRYSLASCSRDRFRCGIGCRFDYFECPVVAVQSSSTPPLNLEIPISTCIPRLGECNMRHNSCCQSGRIPSYCISHWDINLAPSFTPPSHPFCGEYSLVDTSRCIRENEGCNGAPHQSGCCAGLSCELNLAEIAIRGSNAARTRTCVPAQATCGNGRLEPWEVCDGDLHQFSCAYHGYAGGTLQCNQDCLVSSYEGCFRSPLPPPVFTSSQVGNSCNPLGGVCQGDANCCAGLMCLRAGSNQPGRCFPKPICGDGTRNGAEECDRNDLGGATCISLGRGFNGGTLLCSNACTFNTSGCASPPPPQACLQAGQSCTTYSDTCCNGLRCTTQYGAVTGTCSANSCAQPGGACSTTGPGLPCCNGLQCNVPAGSTNFRGTCGPTPTCAATGDPCTTTAPASYCCTGLLCQPGYSQEGSICRPRSGG